jgi:hypothetical protein
MSPSSPDESPPHKEDGAVCPKCLLSNSPMAAFCADCGAPIGMVSTIDPIQHIRAEGFAYRSAVEGPPKLIIVIGMWLIFGPAAVVFGPVAFVAVFLSLGTSPYGFLIMALLLIVALVPSVILYRTTNNYIVKSRAARELSD